MERAKKEYAKLVSQAKQPSGVEELMKVYQRFQKANAITTEYLKLVSPTTYQLSSNKSLLD
jgi:hypothetical protein